MPTTIADLEEEMYKLHREHEAELRRVTQDHGKHINALLDEVESLRRQITDVSVRVQRLEHGK